MDLVNNQEDFKTAMSSQVSHLAAQVEQVLSLLTRSPSAPATAATPSSAAAGEQTASGLRVPAPHLASPERYSGEPGECRAFIIDCEMHFEYMPSAFTTQRSKIAFMISHLTGRARAWATAEWSRDSFLCHSIEDFVETLKRVFDPTLSHRERARKLSSIKQGKDSVCDYAIRFRTLAADSGWNDTALYDVFLKGLTPFIQDLFVPLDLPSSLDALIALAIKTDNRLLESKQNRASSADPRLGRAAVGERSVPPIPSRSPRRRESSEVGEEPMQLGRATLSTEERRRRRQEGRCFYCGRQDHLLAACPVKGQAHQ